MCPKPALARSGMHKCPSFCVEDRPKELWGWGAGKGPVPGKLGIQGWRSELRLQAIVIWACCYAIWPIVRLSARPRKCHDACMSCLYQHVCLTP